MNFDEFIARVVDEREADFSDREMDQTSGSIRF